MYVRQLKRYFQIKGRTLYSPSSFNLIIKKHFSTEDKEVDFIPSVTIVKTKEQAEKALAILLNYENRFHSWDTETINVNPKEQTPVGNGQVICLSCFIGPDVDFGNGARLFIDNYGESIGLINVFKNYFQNRKYLKVWHNYGFDRHVIYNHNINVKGFGGDTMHMARMYDTSILPGHYSLEKLSLRYNTQMMEIRNKYIDHFRNEYIKNNDSNSIERLNTYMAFNNGILKKIDMKTLFEYKKILKTGEEGKSFVMPSIEELHTNPLFRNKWITYSVLDTECTFYLRDFFHQGLQSMSTQSELHYNPIYSKCKNNYELYLDHWRDFGELLTDMEREGFKVDVSYLKQIQSQAETDLKLYENKFLEWVYSVDEKLVGFNPGSTNQMQQLLFGPCYRKVTNLNKEKLMKRKIDEGEEKNSEVEEITEDDDTEDSNKSNKEKPKQKDSKMILIVPEVRIFKIENSYGFENENGKVLKKFELKIKGFGIEPLGFTEGGVPAVDQFIMKAMLKKEENGMTYAYNQMLSKTNSAEKSLKFQEAIEYYEKYKSIETLLKTYILPLQESCDFKGRIHCSLNLNTDTGRLSSRRPNLQNQPSSDKDIYKIREAFKAEKGNKLLVADYGQLELRVLANITNCKSMIEAFELGGDFHSRTALSMFPEIQDAINKGSCILEWDNTKGEKPAPLLKDLFSAQRKKAKTMNFSIAYGKSAAGFAKDWNCSIEEANEMLRKWYSSRKEVEVWQKNIKNLAIEKAYTQTLLGRYRNLSSKISNSKTFNHGLRAAINTPIQGGAADIVIAAMVKLKRNKKLAKLGYKIVLQIHDEVIMEGPEKNADEALKLMIDDMENPIDYKFKVKLEVDAKKGDSWYQAK